VSDFTQQNDNMPVNYSSAFNTYYTYSFINNSQFYALVPTAYVDFYRRFVRQWFYWYDGYVPYFHNQNNGIFSTRLATSLVRKMASQINGGQMMLAEKDRSPDTDNLKFANDWAERVDLSNKMDTAIEFACAGGTSLLKLNSDGKDLWFDPMRMDNYFVDVDWKGDVDKFTGFVHSYTKTIREGQNHIFYLLEERFYKKAHNKETNEWVYKPFVKYIVKRASQSITTARSFDMSGVQQIEWQSVPKKIRDSIKKDYGMTKIDEDQPLPFDDLGCYLMKYTNHVSNIPQLGFGESMLSTVISYLMLYDYAISGLGTNMYLGRSRVMMPKPMQNPNAEKALNYNDGFDSFLYTKMMGFDPKTMQPTPLQFDLRAKDWQTNTNQILEKMATSIGINASTIAGYLGGGGEKTAREVSVEEGATTLYVENKRSIIKTPINRMLNTVMKFYKQQESIVVKFSRAGLTNVRNLVEIAQILKATKIVDDKTLLEFVFTDKTPGQIEEIFKANQKQLEEERKANLEAKSASSGPEKSMEKKMEEETVLSRTKNDNVVKDGDIE